MSIGRSRHDRSWFVSHLTEAEVAPDYGLVMYRGLAQVDPADARPPLTGETRYSQPASESALELVLSTKRIEIAEALCVALFHHAALLARSSYASLDAEERMLAIEQKRGLELEIDRLEAALSLMLK